MVVRKTCFISKYVYGNKIVDLDEYVVSLGTGCNLGCEYCYLKFSKVLGNPTVYENLDNITVELTNLFSLPKSVFYFNCGETTDSLLTDQHIHSLSKLISIISNLAENYEKKCFIELRTKTANLLKKNEKNLCKHSKNVKIIYTASLAPQNVVSEFEKHTATVQERLQSLSYAQQLGFLIGLRFEPIILYPVNGITYNDVISAVENLIANYEKLINSVVEKIETQKLHSITFSCLRLTRQQFRQLLQNRSKLCFYEMFLCPDKKYRYSRPIRTEIYSRLISLLRNCLGNEIVLKIFLATEFDYIWRDCGLVIKNLTSLSF